MATYTDIGGPGKLTTANIPASANTITITTPTSLTGSAYFTLETVRNVDGVYDSSSPTNAIGTYANLSGVSSLVTSSYIFSVVVENGGGSFTFTPAAQITAGTAYVRGTGGISVQI
jgi:hypothetical protein